MKQYTKLVGAVVCGLGDDVAREALRREGMRKG